VKLKKKEISVDKLKGMPFISPPNRGNIIYTPKGKPLINTKRRALIDWLMGRNNFDKVGGQMIHGRLFKMPWRLQSIEKDSSGSALRATVVFETKNDKYLLKHFGDAEFSLTYTLSKDTGTNRTNLETKVKVTNKSDKDYPLVGFGFHPYFVTPKGSSFRIPAQKKYEDHEGIPTGKLSPVQDTDTEGSVDRVFTDLLRSPDSQAAISTIQLANKLGNSSIQIEQSEIFNHLVVYNGSEGYTCIEPQTCATDATRLAYKKNIAEASPSFLPARETVEGIFKISTL
jgi:galactose mutarotase-like enzyme